MASRNVAFKATRMRDSIMEGQDKFVIVIITIMRALLLLVNMISVSMSMSIHSEIE